jgi:hypothetical protein
MSSLDHFQAPLDADMEKQRAELAAIIRRNTAEDGSYATAVDSLFMSRHSQNHDFAPVLAQPALCIMAQGARKFGSPMSSSITTRSITWSSPSRCH